MKWLMILGAVYSLHGEGNFPVSEPGEISSARRLMILMTERNDSRLEVTMLPFQ